MKRLIICFIISCDKQINLDLINGYWEIVSVSKNNEFDKEYHLAMQLIFIIDSLNKGYRKNKTKN